ncbi:steroidogenic acute regulatory protein-like [Stomoxys calcitrans]|uniref:START domain-containing protein n=1 Tax=Stomoxys calcitrans TaxID=35570 RepID=A0A1I8PIL6_STOCA|nr:steroidogenic acute regulatory protein-like [Stomoxys calcitrans]
MDDEDYHRKALQCIYRTYGLLCDYDWRMEKITKRGETISSIYREGYGKIYKLTCSLQYPAQALCHDIFHNIEEVPTWNPTMLESKVIKKINSYTEIGQQALRCGGGAGLIQSRDFVNLCCWRLLVNGEMQESPIDFEHFKQIFKKPSTLMNEHLENEKFYRKNGRVWLNAAMSLEYPNAPPTMKFVRGENLISGFAACEVENNPDVCIFEWILCLDLKGYIPRSLLDRCYTTFMTDYMQHFQKHVDELRQVYINKSC